MHHRTGRALGERIGDEGVAIAGLALQRDEQIARLQGARVDRHAGGGERRAIAPPVASSRSLRGPQRGHARRCLAPARRRTTSTSSNGITVVADRLSLLVALARHRQHVAGAETVQRLGDRARPVADLAAAGAGGQHGGADRGRVLAARIVVGDDGDIGKARRGGAHQRALAAIAIAAGAEHHVQPARRVRAQRGQQPLQRVGGMRVIDIDRGAVRQARRQFQPAAHAAQRGQPIQRIALAERDRPVPRRSGHCRPGTGPAAAA